MHIMIIMRQFLTFLSIVFILGSCGEYQKIKKSTNAEFKLKKAIEFFNNGQYAKTLDLLDDIQPLYRGREKAQTIAYYYAYSLYEQKMYIDAGHYFNQLIALYPNSPYAEESLYMKGYTYYLGSPNILLDQEATHDAIEALNVYTARYPQSARVSEANKLIDDLNNKLVEKSFISAKTYYDRDIYDSAIIALENSLKDYPNSKHREDILFMLLESRYQLAVNSFPDKKRDRYNAAKEEYYTFQEEFPESEYINKANRIIKDIDKYLGTE